MQECKPKEKIEKIDGKYDAYCKKIEFILFTGCNSEFKAASTYLRKPSVESHEAIRNIATSLKPNIAIGSFAGGPIALIQRSTEKDMKKFINDIMGIFPVAKYFISVGTGFGFQQKEMKVGDVFISSGLIAVDEYSVSIDGTTAHIYVQGHHSIQTIELLQKIFCDTSVQQNFRVTKDRTADYQVSNIVSSVTMAEDTRLYNKTSIAVHPSVVGGDINGRELLQWQNDGKITGFIVIKSVIGYVGERKSDTWKFTGALAAVHYVEQKMIPYMGKLNINLSVCNDQYLRYNLHYQFSVV